MSFVDLHVHSNASDGSLSPAKVVDAAIKKGLKAIALTDHDTISGIPKAIDAAKGTGLEVIPGIELSCVYHGTEIHILGLYADVTNINFTEALSEILQVRENRNLDMIRRFQENEIQITKEDLCSGNAGTVITRAHFARVLTEKGYAKDRNAAFKQYLQYEGPYCRRKEEISTERAMELLNLCGSFPILAHPMLYKLGDRALEIMTEHLKTLGLMGIEVYHSSNHQLESRKLLDLAKHLDLLPSGGSDFHGSNKPDIEIGSGRGGLQVSSLLLDDIKNRMQLQRSS